MVVGSIGCKGKVLCASCIVDHFLMIHNAAPFACAPVWKVKRVGVHSATRFQPRDWNHGRHEDNEGNQEDGSSESGTCEVGRLRATTLR